MVKMKQLKLEITLLPVILLIFFITICILIITIFNQKTETSMDCTISNLNYETIKYVDPSFNEQNFNLNNSTISCKGNIKIANWIVLAIN
jgi:uncharacterized membrane protein